MVCIKDGCFVPGDKYVVVDSVGGTVDLTVHQIRLPEGHLKELYKATGEPEKMREMANFLIPELFCSFLISLSISFNAMSMWDHEQYGYVRPETKMPLNGL